MLLKHGFEGRYCFFTDVNGCTECRIVIERKRRTVVQFKVCYEQIHSFNCLQVC